VHRNGTILFRVGDQPRTLQTGEIVQVGRAWKLVDGPGGGLADAGPNIPLVIDLIKPLVEKLDAIDRATPMTPTPEELAAHNVKRVEVLEQIVAKLPPNQQETWVKLLIDSLGSAAVGDKPGGRYLHRLKQFEDAFAKPGMNQAVGAYAAYRYLVAENSVALKHAKPGEFDAVQDRWRAGLEKFVKAFPNSDDAPEALLRLAMACEYQKDGEAKAKEWYQQLAQKKHPHAAKAAGAVKRLTSDGQPLEVSGPTLEDNKPFTTTTLKDKVVVVYYCAGWSETLPDDVRRLKALV